EAGVEGVGEGGMGASCGGGGVEPPRACHGELRAERARCAAARCDDCRDRDLFAFCAPFLGLGENVVHLVWTVAMDPLDEVLAQVDTGALGDPLPVLAYLAGQAVELGDEELNGARRRALLLVAAGGDPHRELAVDDRAVKALATDLYTEERRDELGRSIDAIVVRVRDLPSARDAALFLASDVDLAWRLFAMALLAEELAE